jgi:hypothetical protein
VRLPCVTPSLPLWRAPSARHPLRRILHRPLRPERVEEDCHLGKPAPSWEQSPQWIVCSGTGRSAGGILPASAHTHTTALSCLFCIACLPGLAAAAPTLGRLTLQLQRILVEISAASARPWHSSSLAPPRASGDSLSAFCRFWPDEPLPASREAGTAACATRKLTPTNSSSHHLAAIRRSLDRPSTGRGLGRSEPRPA